MIAALTPPFSDLLANLDRHAGVPVLVTGQLADGSDHYAYASIPPSRYQAFKAAEAKGHYDLAAYGTILMHGKGLAPPPAVEQQMREEHGANHLFEQELEEATDRLQAAPLRSARADEN